MSETQPQMQTKKSLCKSILHNIREVLGAPGRWLNAPWCYIPLYDEEKSNTEAICVQIQKDNRVQIKVLSPVLPNQLTIDIRIEYLNDHQSFEAIPTELMIPMTNSQPV
jgi:hypothetical protein